LHFVGVNFMKLIPAILVGAAFLAANSVSRADTLLSENFDNISLMTGWVMTNASSPVGTTNWFQGNGGIFKAQAGADDSYLASNFLAGQAGGTVSNWLITPQFSTAAAGTVSFWVQAVDEGYADALSYGFSTGGSNTADFNMSPATVITPQGEWLRIDVIFSASDPGSVARFAIEHNNSSWDDADYIGVDTLRITTDVAGAVPEPSTWAMMILGFAGVGFMAYLRKSKPVLMAA
jgi:hypothetical protein